MIELIANILVVQYFPIFQWVKSQALFNKCHYFPDYASVWNIETKKDKNFEGTLMQIWNSPYMFVFIDNTLKSSHSYPTYA